MAGYVPATLAIYNSASEAAKENRCDVGNIISACKANARTDKKRKKNYKRSAYGFVWLFENDATDKANKAFSCK